MNLEQLTEKIIKIETHVEYIKENMMCSSTGRFLKWALGVVTTISVSALIMASKLVG